MSKYTEKDAAKDTNSSNKEVESNWHQAREDARASGELTDRPATTPSPNAKNEPDTEKVSTSFWKSLGF
jgi:hypothetical protein